MYYRNTKNRIPQSQLNLRFSTKRSKVERGSPDVYSHTYGIALPTASYDIMLPCIRGFTGGLSAPNTSMRSLHTIGVWANSKGDLCRCAFIQPELASATCTIPRSKVSAAESARAEFCRDVPFAEECRIGPQTGRVNGTPQISGRMAPYVVSTAQIDSVASWGFANLCKFKLLFLVSDCENQRVMCPTRTSLAILKGYMPEFAVCIYDDGMSCYRITVSPDFGCDSAEPNKNTSLIIYGDGSMKLQGKPRDMERVCSALHDSIHSASSGPAWERFLKSMSEIASEESVGGDVT